MGSESPFWLCVTHEIAWPCRYSSATSMRFGIPLALVFLTINDEQRDREIRDHRATLYTSFRRYVEANPVYVPFATPSPLTTAVCTSLTACP